MLFANMLIASLCLWLVISLNNKYLRPVIKNKERFKLYKLRDNLSILAMKGEIDESSEEYITLLSLINSSINATGSFQVTDFLKFLFRIHKDKEMRRRIERIKDRVRNTDNKKYCELASEYFSVMHVILHKDTAVLRIVLLPVMVLVTTIIAILKISIKPKIIVDDKKEIFERIDNELNDYRHQFSGMCTT